jgi:glycosyltransferase involved in cell wall biosynthesis
MRILLDLQACQAGSMHRGIGRYSLSLAKALVRQGGDHDIQIILNSLLGPDVEAMRRSFEGWLPASSIHCFDLPYPIAEHDRQNAWRVRAAELVREHYIAALNPDVVHVASLFEGYAEDAACSVSGRHRDQYVTAVTLYDLIPLLRKDIYLTDPSSAQWYYRKLQSLKNADLLLAISAHSRNEAIDALQLPGEQVVNISSAVDDIFQPRVLPAEERAALQQRYGLQRKFIMYTGGIDHRKNIEGLIEAYAMLPDQLRTQFQLAIVCKVSDADLTRLHRLAAGLDLKPDDLVLTGFVPDQDLVALYQSTTLFVFPSLHEGFGLPALEAMACGAAVIGSDASSIPEVIGLADALFDPTSPTAICAAIRHVLSSPQELERLRTHGLQQAALFSWDGSARRALDAMQAEHERRVARTAQPAAPALRPRLAYVSPLPPERSGIADYSQELLPELARYYDIELVLAQDQLSDPWLVANFPVRTASWFEQHGSGFDRIVYHFGNSLYHQHMFALLERHPGIVVLHDFFLSGTISMAEPASDRPNNFARTLYLSHGYPALAEEASQGRNTAVQKYPCNKLVLDQATGVIVHSRHAMALACAWYGARAAEHWRQLPLLRALPGTSDRRQARAALGLADDDFLVVSFGMISASKCNDRIINAWLASALHRNARCHLVFVGENEAHQFGRQLSSLIAAHPRIRITGFASKEVYRRYQAAADAAIQLRVNTRGETSATVLDCLAYGLPLIANAHGSAAEIPADVCIKLPDACIEGDVVAALEQLHGQPALRARLTQSALDFMQKEHHPAETGLRYHASIEALHATSSHTAYRQLLQGLARIEAGAPDDSDLVQTALCIDANATDAHLPQLLVDISGLVDGEDDPVLRGMLQALVTQEQPGWRVEPVRAEGGHYRYARRYILDLLGLGTLRIEDAVAAVRQGDLLFELAQAVQPPPAARSTRVSWRDAAAALPAAPDALLPLLERAEP